MYRGCETGIEIHSLISFLTLLEGAPDYSQYFRHSQRELSPATVNIGPERRAQPHYFCSYTGMQQNDGPASVSDFFDALTAYAIDPTRWTDLLSEFDRLSDHLESWDPGELVAELSRAESLSWRIKDSGDPARPGFAYLLLDADDRVVGGEENLPALAGFLSLDDAGRLQFSDPASRRSLD